LALIVNATVNQSGKTTTTAKITAPHKARTIPAATTSQGVPAMTPNKPAPVVEEESQLLDEQLKAEEMAAAERELELAKQAELSFVEEAAISEVIEGPTEEELARQAEMEEAARVEAKMNQEAEIRALYERSLSGQSLTPAQKEQVEANRSWLEPRGREGSVDATGGPDDFGYAYVDNQAPDAEPFYWIELCGDPLASNGPSGDDGGAWVSFGSMFFPFYGVNYTQGYVSTNGTVSFTGAYTGYSNTQMGPTTTVVDTMMAVYWDDQKSLTHGGCNGDGTAPWIRYRAFDDDSVVIQWEENPDYVSSGTPLYFWSYEVILYPSGDFKFMYNTDFDVEPTASATVGIDIPTSGNHGVGYVYNTTGNLIGPGRAIRWYLPPGLEHDFATASLVSPSTTVWYEPNATADVSAIVQNVGTTAESSPVYYIWNDGAPVGPYTTGVLNEDEMEQANFGTQITMPATEGIYVLKVYTDLATDLDRGNDTLFANIVVQYCYDQDLGSTLPVALTNETTCGLGNDHSNTCLGSYDGDEEKIYRWTVTTAGEYTITMTPLGGATWTGFALDDACPPDPTTCLATVTRSDATPRVLPCFALEPGTYYIMVDIYPSPFYCFDYDLSIVECTPCEELELCDPGLPEETEPNNQCLTAIEDTLGCEGAIYARFCPEADSDWYVIEIPAMTLMAINLYDGVDCATSPATNVQFKLSDDACGTPVGPYVAQSILNCTENVMYKRLLVYTKTGGSRTAYKLTATCTTELYCGTPTETEPNNTCATFDAYPLDCTNNVVYGLHCPASDSDFFKITVPAGTMALIKAYDGIGCTVNPPTTVYTQLYTADCVASGIAGTANKTVNRCAAATDTTVYLLVKNYGTTTNYEGAYKVEVVCTPAPANDLCANAIATSIGSSVLGNNYCATPETDVTVPTCDGYSPGTTGKGVWYTFVGNGNLVQVGTCNANTPTMDTRVLVFSGDCDNLVCVTGDDDDCATPGLASLDTLCATLDVTYYVLVYDFSGGVFQLDLVDLGIDCSIGRCCYGDPYDPTCEDGVTSAYCDGVSGTWVTGLNCTDNPCPSLAGENCDHPKVIGTDACSVVGQTNCGSGNAYSTTCLGSYDGGEDIIYVWTVETAGPYEITLDPGTTTWTGILVDDNCPPDETGCIAYHTITGSGPHSIICTDFPVGTYYIMVDTYPSPNCIPDFDITITGGCVPPRPCASCEPEDAILDPVPTAYGMNLVNGNCGNGGKWVGEFTGVAGNAYYFDVCPNTPGAGTGNFDADIKILDASCNILAGEDGSCSGGPNSWLPNDFEWVCGTSGTYYVVFAPYSSYNTHNCTGLVTNTFTLDYYTAPWEPPCPMITCSPTVEEVEPNSGCLDENEDFTAVACGDVVHGTITATTSLRDVDFYALTLATPSIVTITVDPEFLAGIWLGRTDGLVTCPDIGVAGIVSPTICEDVQLVSACLPAGEYHIEIYPEFANYPIPQDYCMTIACEPCVVPTGRCCYGEDPFDPICVDGVTEFACDDLAGTWTEGLNCVDDPCPLPPSCPEGTMYGQRPHLSTESWEFSTSELNPGYIVFDDFYAADMPISGLTFWGIAGYNDGSGWVTCMEDPMPFEIKFYYDDGSGYPDVTTPVCTYNVSLSGVADGEVFAGLFQQYKWTTPLDPPCTINPGWFSIQGLGEGTCWFLWASSPEGTGASWQYDGAAYSANDYSRAYCFEGAPCDPVEDVTVYLVPGNANSWLHFTAPQAGDYDVYSSVVPNNDGDPREGDPDFTLETTLTALTDGETMVWTDPAAFGTYKVYVVIHSCAGEVATGRCCYGDLEQTCEEGVSLTYCNGLGGTWTYNGTCPCPAPSYCTASYSNTTDDWITNVTFNTINNTTGQDGTSSYGDYTAISTTVTQGLAYDLSVSFSSGTWTECVSVWFDWNQNYEFEASERYDLGCGATTTFTVNIAVPLDATIGSTRLRVIEEYYDYPVDACPVSTYGEIEDYTVVIQAP